MHKKYDEKYTVYVLKTADDYAMKIGYSHSVKERISDLQIANPRQLILINEFHVEDKSQAVELERHLQDKYKKYNISGEWYDYLPELEDPNIIEEVSVRRKSTVRENRKSIKDHPRCFFYPYHDAHIMTSYDKADNMKVPFRMMKYPTFGKKMVLPYSDMTDRVFISVKKHKENLELKRWLDNKKPLSLFEVA